MKTTEEYLGMAVRLARQNVENGRGRPFGAVLVKDGEVIGIGASNAICDRNRVGACCNAAQVFTCGSIAPAVDIRCGSAIWIYCYDARLLV